MVRVCLATAAVAVVGVLLIAVLRPDRLTAIAIVSVALLIFALVAYGVVGDKPYQLDLLVPLPQTTIEQHAFLWFTTAGWTLISSGAGALTFTRRAPPRFAPALSFLLFGVLPSLLYLLVGGRKLTATLLTTAEPGGTRLKIAINTRTSGGEETAINFVNTLRAMSPVALSRPAHPVP
jgi:hypothetical protein